MSVYTNISDGNNSDSSEFDPDFFPRWVTLPDDSLSKSLTRLQIKAHSPISIDQLLMESVDKNIILKPISAMTNFKRTILSKNSDRAYTQIQ